MNTYANLDELKNAGLLNITTTAYDSDLLDAIEEGSRQLDKDTDRFFYIYEGTFYQDGGAIRLILDWDVQSITTLDVDTDGDGVYESSFNLTTTSPDAFLYPLNVTPKTRLEANPWGKYGHFGAGIRNSVKITGLFGYGNDWPSSYTISSGDGVGSNLNSTDVSLTVTTGGILSAGHTLRINSEQLYIYSQPVGTAVPVQRAVNGTIANTLATTGTIVSIYQYPKTITKAVIIYAMRIWKRRESAFQNQVGNPELGTITVWKGNDPDYDKAVIKYKKTRRGWYLK